MAASPRIAFAANRQVGLDVLDVLLDFGLRPVMLLVPGDRQCTAISGMMERLPGVPVLRGKRFREAGGLSLLRAADLDYILSIHFPYIIPPRVLRIPRTGTLNLHPSLLPFNRGWHTPTWAIVDDTPYGATLHWMDEGLDSGPIALQRLVRVYADDTADRLYQRVLETEVQLMREAVPRLINDTLPRQPQGSCATKHRMSDIESLQPLRLQDQMTVETLLRRLRALSTNRWEEAAFFEKDGEIYRVRVEIRKDSSPAPKIPAAA